MTVSQIEPHHQNDHNHYEGPAGSKEKYKDFVLPGDLAALKEMLPKNILITSVNAQVLMKISGDL